MVSGLLAKRMDRIFNGKRSRTSAHYGCVVFGANEEIVLLESSSQEITPHLQHFFHFKCFFQRVCLGQNEAKLKTVEVESGEHIEFGSLGIQSAKRNQPRGIRLFQNRCQRCGWDVRFLPYRKNHIACGITLFHAKGFGCFDSRKQSEGLC